ncbi:MAG: hypothetical protein N2487_05090, partial [Verrucomicrobiae bacterium]|nr:hypothetical protein [Verrucomicrobiae bacterium]
HRVVITTDAHYAEKIISRAKIYNYPAVQIGKVGGNILKIKTDTGEFAWDLTKLHDLWWNSLAKAMQ